MEKFTTIYNSGCSGCVGPRTRDNTSVTVTYVSRTAPPPNKHETLDHGCFNDRPASWRVSNIKTALLQCVMFVEDCPADSRLGSDAELLLGQHRRRWPNIDHNRIPVSCMHVIRPPPVLRSFSERGGGVWSDKRSLHVTIPLFNVGSMLALWWSWPSIQPALCQHPVRILNIIRQYLHSWRPILPPKHIVPWIWKGVSATLQNVRYILPYPCGRFFCA